MNGFIVPFGFANDSFVADFVIRERTTTGKQPDWHCEYCGSGHFSEVAECIGGCGAKRTKKSRGIGTGATRRGFDVGAGCPPPSSLERQQAFIAQDLGITLDEAAAIFNHDHYPEGFKSNA